MRIRSTDLKVGDLFHTCLTQRLGVCRDKRTRRGERVATVEMTDTLKKKDLHPNVWVDKVT